MTIGVKICGLNSPEGVEAAVAANPGPPNLLEVAAFQLERQFHAAQVSAYFSFGKLLKAKATQGLALDVFAKIPLAGREHAVLYSFGGGLAYGF